jgi:hypothetical protein
VLLAHGVLVQRGSVRKGRVEAWTSALADAETGHLTPVESLGSGVDRWRAEVQLSVSQAFTRLEALTCSGPGTVLSAAMACLAAFAASSDAAALSFQSTMWTISGGQLRPCVGRRREGV